jgi:phosphoglycerate dehydrogenase-like enzyme
LERNFVVFGAGRKIQLYDKKLDLAKSQGQNALKGKRIMATSSLWIGCNFGLDEEERRWLEGQIGAHRIQWDCRDWKAVDIAFGQPDAQAVITAPRLRWIHITSAGYTPYDTPEMRATLHERGAVFTNSSHVFDEPCAQHVLAMMLSLSRALPQCVQSQLAERDWPSGQRRAESWLLRGQTVLLLGYGAISKRLAQMLAPFEMRIITVRRRPQKDGATVEEVGEDDLERVLSQADHVVNSLPQSPSTIGFVDAERFSRMKHGAFFYNIGRGKTVDQNALLKVLCDGHLGGAYLDVTDPEPLPPDHGLWTAPNCHITPHSGGGHQDETRRLMEHFVSNLQRFEAGEPLLDRVLNEDSPPTNAQ